MPNFPNRCQHIKVNGTQCGSPALRRNRFCYFHKLHHEERVELNLDRLKNARRRKLTIALPVLEDANSIQVSLMQIMRLIVAGQIDGKTAGLLLYALQTASSNLPRTNFQPFVNDVVLDLKSVHRTPLSSHVWEDEDFPSREREEDEDESPREGFTPRTAEEARNQAELDRWAEAEADRLAIIGAREYEVERQAQLRIDQLKAKYKLPGVEAESAEEMPELPLKSLAPQSTEPAAAVTPAGRAILPTKTISPTQKRPPANVSLDEVRKKVTAEIRKELPAIAAAFKTKTRTAKADDS